MHWNAMVWTGLDWTLHTWCGLDWTGHCTPRPCTATFHYKSKFKPWLMGRPPYFKKLI